MATIREIVAFFVLFEVCGADTILIATRTAGGETCSTD